MKTMNRLTLALAALSIVAAACGSDTSDTTVPDAPAPDPIKLAGTRWVATKMFVGGAEVPLVPNASPTIDFDGNGRSAGGSTGCNSWFGDVSLGAGTIAFTGLGQTEMACEPPRMQQEATVLGVLQEASIFTLGDGTLTLGRVGGSTIEFIDRAVVFPDAELTGIHWVADTIIRGAAASTMLASAPVTLFIDPANSEATGSAGCNDYEASVEWGPDQLTFGTMSVTKRGCVDDAVSVQEQFVLSVLQGELDVAIDGDRLTITTLNGDGLGFRAER